MKTPNYSRSFVLSLALLCSVSTELLAQAPQDSTVISSSLLPRPRLELGLGALSFYGDIGMLPNGIGQSAELSWGYRAALINPISKSFDLNIFALFGTIRANERVVGDEANLQNSVRMGGLSLSYNFNALLPVQRNITPYLSLGVSTFEFNPKGDHYDAEGRRYNYWNDGSIRSLPESDPNAADAIMLRRDYTFETDLRLESDRERDYALRSFSVPLGIGANLAISPSFTVRMGAEYHFTFTDNIDNIALPGDEGRKGNDHLLFSSIGLSYNLQHAKRKKTETDELSNEDLLALDYADEDADGVADIIDQCPFTPAGVPIGKYGCPLDTDGDGVADYQDKEINTPAGAPVNFEGVALTEADIEAQYALYMSGGKMNFDKSSLSTADVARKRRGEAEGQKGYIIEILETGNLQTSDVSRILSIKDIRAVEKDGEMVYFVGTIADLNDAVNRDAQLKELGLQTKMIYTEFGNQQDVNAATLAEAERNRTNTVTDANEVTFRVQIGAYRYRLSQNVFSEVPDLLIVEGNDGVTRYVSGSFGDIQSAAEHKIDLLLKGSEGAFVTAYRGGQRIKLSEAGARVTGADESLKATEPGAIDKSLVKFSIQVGSFQGRVPADVLGKYLTLGSVRPVRGEGGTTRYISGSYNSTSEANTALANLRNSGFIDAFVVGEFNGQVISAEEAQKIKQ